MTLSIGFYPTSETMEYTEDFPSSSSDTLTRLCSDWEDSANLPDDCKTRLVKIRIGVVLGRNGGVIQQTIWPYWLGLGGTVLSSTISLHVIEILSSDNCKATFAFCSVMPDSPLIKSLYIKISHRIILP